MRPYKRKPRPNIFEIRPMKMIKLRSSRDGDRWADFLSKGDRDNMRRHLR